MADGPLQRWLQPQLPSPTFVHHGTLSCPIKQWTGAGLELLRPNDGLIELLNRKSGSKLKWRLLYAIKFWGNLLPNRDNWDI